MKTIKGVSSNDWSYRKKITNYFFNKRDYPELPNAKSIIIETTPNRNVSSVCCHEQL